MTATTYTINKLPSAVSDNNVDLMTLTQAAFSLNLDRSGPGFAFYDYATGDNSLPAAITSRLTQNKKIAIPTFQWTLAFETSQLETDGDSNIVIGSDVTYGLWVKGPIRHRPTAAEVLGGLGAVYAATGASISAGAIDTGRVTRMLQLNPYVMIG